jgi:aminomethyltransferase
MERAGLDAELELLHFRKLLWRDLDVTLSRFGEHGGYEIWCKADDASLVWNRIVKAGEPFACIPAGAEAMDILDLEAGVLRPGRDYEAARDGFAAQPTPSDLGLLSLIDDEHTLFNGRSALLAAKGTKTRVGVQMDGDAPAPRTPLLRNGHRVGETMNARYSPALQCAIALAVIDKTDAVVDMRLALPDGSAATVVDLPFLPVPDPIAE